MSTHSIEYPCPLCDTTITVPYTSTTSPVHALDEKRFSIQLDETAIREHIGTHTSGPNGGIPVRSAA